MLFAFHISAPAPAAGGLFGAPAPAAGGLFGSTMPAPAAGGGLFGAAPAMPAPAGKSNSIWRKSLPILMVSN